MSENMPYDRVTEGSATILLPSGNQDVFYNKVQVVNRDLSIAAISAYNDLRREEHLSSSKTCSKPYPGLTILEALSATGLRSMRYLHEIDDVSKIIVNDIDPAAVETIKRNIAANPHLVQPERLVPNCADANICMGHHTANEGRVDVVDLDPYGSANTFISSALKAVRPGGMLCITCTDLAVLAGSRPSACFAKYSSMPHRAKYCHEMALRIVLAFTCQEAAKLGLVIEPLASSHIDFYVRLFVRVRKSQSGATASVKNLAYVWQCSQCVHHVLIPVMHPTGKGDNLTSATALRSGQCPDCHSPMKMGGPWWSAPIHDPAFLARLSQRIDRPENPFASQARLRALLTGLMEELVDVPLFHCLSSMCHTLHCVMPRAIVVRSALINGGFRVSQSHTSPTSLKTDAPSNIIWDILRHWVKQNPVKQNLSETSPSSIILSKEPQSTPDFTIVDALRNKTKQPKFLPNPEDHWGPGSRAKTRHASLVDIPQEPDEKKARLDLH